LWLRLMTTIAEDAILPRAIKVNREEVEGKVKSKERTTKVYEELRER
jgi:hypothetical protein